MPGAAASGVSGGASAAARLVERIAADPRAGLAAAVVGPGGTGKTAVLDDIARAYREAGADVTRLDAHRAPLGRIDPDRVLLVDDAHLLDDRGLGRLRAVADDTGGRVVVAHRPWPRPELLGGPGAANRRPFTIVLGHLDRSAVADQIARRVDRRPADDLVDLVFEQSGGLPRLVDIVVRALIDSGRFDVRQPERFHRPERVGVSMALAHMLRHWVDVLEPPVRGLLEALAVGAPLEADVLSSLTGAEPNDLVGYVEAARATGLLTDTGDLIPFARSLLLRLTPVLRLRALRRGLAEIQLDGGGTVLAAGRQLLATGASGRRDALVLAAAADEALSRTPDVAAALYAAATAAGAHAVDLAARRARAVALCGDLTEAMRLADGVLTDPTHPGHDEALSVAAAASAHRGLLAHSAALHLSRSPSAAGGAALAVPALVGTGALDGAHSVLAGAPDRGPSTLLDGAAILMGQGMIATVTGPPPAALSLLARAAILLEPIAATTLLPDTPAALAAVVAMHCGEFELAEDALQHAADSRQGGPPARTRHILLLGWLRMMQGRLEAATRALRHVGRGASEARDELVAAALTVALARRRGDVAALAAGWARARGALLRQPVDLYTLLPLGELAVAAADLGERDRLTLQLDEAHQLLAAVGAPPLWSAPLAWYLLQAAVAADSADEAREHADTLQGIRSVGNRAAAAYASAVETWMGIAHGRVDARAAQDAARRLHGVGLRWEGAHLARQAAERADDRRDVTALHACARTLLPSGAPGEPTGTPDPEVGQHDALPAIDLPLQRAPTEDAAGLSDRELEIGRLILAGLTYKQIGQQLFISPKTVEHQVARIRQRLGATSRTQLFGLLRGLVPAHEPAEPIMPG